MDTNNHMEAVESEQTEKISTVDREVGGGNVASAERLSTGEILDILRRFSDGFRRVRGQIESMEDDELVELYETATTIGNVSWLIRCVVLGIAKSRAVRGDGTVASLAQTFGIGVRMAEMDIAVYERFIRNNADFEPTLPAHFYRLALGAENPEGAVEYAIEQRTQNPRYPLFEFSRLVKGKLPREKAKTGLFMLVPVEQEDSPTTEVTELFGKVTVFSWEGTMYVEIK